MAVLLQSITGGGGSSFLILDQTLTIFLFQSWWNLNLREEFRPPFYFPDHDMSWPDLPHPI